MKTILDATCGGKMMWYNKHISQAVYADKTQEHIHFSDSRILSVDPDVIYDFTAMPFREKTFHLVIFDPPHVHSLGEKSYMAKTYGKLFPDWETDLQAGFDECFRVLEIYGTLIFKWNTYDISQTHILDVIGRQPLFGQKVGKQNRTHWMVFMKMEEETLAIPAEKE